MDILLGGYEPKTYWGAGGGMCPQCYHPPPPSSYSNTYAFCLQSSK